MIFNRIFILFVLKCILTSDCNCQIEGEYRSNFSIYGLSSENLTIQCDSTFDFENRTENFSNIKKGRWDLKCDTLLLFFHDSLNSIVKYTVIDSSLYKVMPIYPDSIKTLFEKETNRKLTSKDIRPVNMYGKEEEYFLIQKKGYLCK